MRLLSAFLRDETGAAASEFALAMPMILPLIFISMEAGNYFWNQQKLVQAVREGSRYAARLHYDDLCPSLDTNVETDIKNVTRTGTIAGTEPAKLPFWDNSEVTVSVTCGSFVSTGIYDGLGGDSGAIITINAVGVPYRSILGTLGLIDTSFFLAAQAHAPVIGI